MFGRQAETPVGSGGRHSQSILQEGVVVRGEFEAAGDVRLDGRLEGTVRITERVTIGANGSIVGALEAAEVTVLGSFEGTIVAQRRIELRKGARVIADLTTPSLVIEEGVHFHGNSCMEAGSTTTTATERAKASGRPLASAEDGVPELKELLR